MPPATEPIRVLRIVTRLNVGGPTRHVAALMARLDAHGFAQRLATGTPAADEGDGLIAVPGDVTRVPGLGRVPRLAHDLSALRALMALCRAWRPTIVHTHQAKAGFLGRLAARLTHVPIVIHTYHGHTFEHYFHGVRAAAFRWAERRAAGWSQAIIAQSDSQAADIRSHLGAAAAARVVVIPPGVDVAVGAPRGPRDGPPHVVVPARLVDVKDPMLALDVARLLPRAWRLTFRGDGPLGAAVRAAVDADGALRGRVQVLPPLATPAGWLADATVVLLTSITEGTPLALIEAQMAGVPVVAPAVGGVASVVDDEGGAVVPRTAAALAAGLVAVAGRGAMSAVAVEAIRSRFSATRMVGDTAALYRRLLAGLTS